MTDQQQQQRFRFYEEVLIPQAEAKGTDPESRRGVILGISEVPPWEYGVFVFSEHEVVCFREFQLQSTGIFHTREEFYEGT